MEPGSSLVEDHSNHEILEQGGEQKSPPSAILKFNEPLWKYMMKTEKYSSVLKEIKAQTHVTEADDEFAVMLKGDSEDEVEQDKKRLEKLTEDCLQEVKVVVLPELEKDVYGNVVSFLEQNDMVGGCIFTVIAGNRVCLAGKESAVEQSLGVLEEMFGINGAVPYSTVMGEKKTVPHDLETRDDIVSSSSTGEKESGADEKAAPAAVLTLPEKIDSIGDEVDKELYHTEKDKIIDFEDEALIVDERIWAYMEKHSEYMGEIKKKKVPTATLR